MKTALERYVDVNEMIVDEECIKNRLVKSLLKTEDLDEIERLIVKINNSSKRLKKLERINNKLFKEIMLSPSRT